MSIAVLVVLGLLGIFLMLRGSAAARERGPVDLDAETVQQLAAAGADLSRPHRIEFFLYLPARPEADIVAEILRQEGFTVEVSQDEAGSDWLCLATMTMVPQLEVLQHWRGRLTELAETYQGAYDGWGTEVEGG
jgi:hypothetical protein